MFGLIYTLANTASTVKHDPAMEKGSVAESQPESLERRSSYFSCIDTHRNAFLLRTATESAQAKQEEEEQEEVAIEPLGADSDSKSDSDNNDKIMEGELGSDTQEEHEEVAVELLNSLDGDTLLPNPRSPQVSTFEDASRKQHGFQVRTSRPKHVYWNSNSLVTAFLEGVQAQALTFLNTTIPTHSNRTSNLGNTQSHTFTPDFTQLPKDALVMIQLPVPPQARRKLLPLPLLMKDCSQTSLTSTTHSVSSSTAHTAAITVSTLLPSSRSFTSTSSSVASTLSPLPVPSSISAITHRPSSKGALIGGIIGGLLLLAVLSLATLSYTRRKLRLKKLALHQFATPTPLPFTAVSPVSVPGSALIHSPEPRNNSNPKSDLQHPLGGGTVIFEELRLGRDERRGEGMVSPISFVSELEMMDVMTMQRRIELLLAENAWLTSIPPPSYPGSDTAGDYI
ncbi:hypothetical protein BDP27DRAFT_1405751 [Rhodocollybia butyracea]|uniref:Uncharacterized protein n=1 Tax=Rhodocollybia butyracea TaxID=206335 RepID=A0A9P5PHY1_9AGAR|nr:hypothetical protein BDP27DRAFT_1405751 [Rhodocollybia butyracea]